MKKKKKKALIVKQILLISAIRNVWVTVWRINTVILGLKGYAKSLAKVNESKARILSYTKIFD